MARLAYEVNVVNIHFGNDVANWNQNSSRRKWKGGRDEVSQKLPTELVIELPRDFNERFKKRSDADYEDAIESFVYNNLTKRFQKECVSCQIWIGDDLDVVLKRIEDAKRARELAAAEVNNPNPVPDEEPTDADYDYDEYDEDDEDY